MDLDLRDLELLDALADAQTLTAAAKSLYVSQPALSQRLTKMEDKLGVRLFDREGRRLVVNPAGRRMLVASRLVLAELRSAERDVRDIRDGANRRVRFTSQCSTTFQWLPPVLKRFREQQPNIEIRIETVRRRRSHRRTRRRPGRRRPGHQARPPDGPRPPHAAVRRRDGGGGRRAASLGRGGAMSRRGTSTTPTSSSTTSTTRPESRPRRCRSPTAPGQPASPPCRSSPTSSSRWSPVVRA